MLFVGDPTVGAMLMPSASNRAHARSRGPAHICILAGHLPKSGLGGLLGYWP